MDWFVLGIEPTKDKKAITAAYRVKLRQVNPEDKPDEFKLLRSTYEEALNYADAEEKAEEEKSDLDLWTDKLDALYMDFQSRLDPECWRALLRDDYSTGIDTKQDAERAMLVYFMEHYNIPHSVWLVLDEYFDFTARKDELYESYPKEFIDYVVIGGITNSENLKYELFTPGQDAAVCDRYLSLFLQNRKIPFEQMGDSLDEMLSLSEHHPYGDILGCSVRISRGDTDAVEEIQAVADRYPDDTYILNWLADEYNTLERYPDAERTCLRTLELEPENRRARFILAHAIAGQERYAEAVEEINKIMRTGNGDYSEMYRLNQPRVEWNAKLLEQLKERYAAGERENGFLLDLAWAYLLADKTDEALDAVCQMDEETAEPYSYNNLMSQLYMSKGDNEKALDSALKLVDTVRLMKEENKEGCTEKIMRLPEFASRAATLMASVKGTEAGLELFEDGLKEYTDSIQFKFEAARFGYASKLFDFALECCRGIIAQEPGYSLAYSMMASALYEMNRDQEAFEAINRALDLDGSILEDYVTKILILIRNGACDEAISVLQFLDENGLQDDISVKYCRAVLDDSQQEDKSIALEEYEAVAERLNNGENLFRTPELYYRMACLREGLYGIKSDDDAAMLMEIIDKGIAADPEDFSCKEFKAWLYKRNKENEKSLDIYHELEKRPRNGVYVERQLAELYYRDARNNADNAALYYEKVLESDQDDVVALFYLGWCYSRMGKYDKAEQCFLKEKELEPDVTDANVGLTYVYAALGRLEDALEQAETGLALIEDKSKARALFSRKISILRRMNRAEEAVKTAKEMQEAGAGETEKLITEIYEQFGLWTELEKYLFELKKRGGYKELITCTRFDLRLLMGNRRVPVLPLKFSVATSDDEIENRLAVIRAMNGKFRRTINRNRHKNDPYSTLVAAEYSCLDGDRKKAEKYAKEALELNLNEMGKYPTDKAMFVTRMAKIHAILGDEEKAMAEIADARALPLCDMCDYCGCKDADFNEAYIKAVFGHLEEAARLCEEGIRKWPDESDFIMLRNYIRRKGI